MAEQPPLRGDASSGTPRAQRSPLRSENAGANDAPEFDILDTATAKAMSDKEFLLKSLDFLGAFRITQHQDKSGATETKADLHIRSSEFNPRRRRLTDKQRSELVTLLRETDKAVESVEAFEKIEQTEAWKNSVRRGEFFKLASPPAQDAQTGHEKQQEVLDSLRNQLGSPQKDWIYTIMGGGGRNAMYVIYASRKASPEYFRAREELAHAKERAKQQIKQFFVRLR